MFPETSEFPPVSSTQSIEDIRLIQKVKPEEIDFNKDDQIINFFQPDNDFTDNKLESDKKHEPSEVALYPICIKITTYQLIYF